MSFWLLDVLDEAEIETHEQLDKAFREPQFSQSIFDAAMAEDSYSLSPIESRGETLLAAHGLDLSGSLGCSHFDCVRADLDRLLSRTWFYFDQIAVVGPSKQVVRRFVNNDSAEYAVDRLLNLMRTLLYVRNIGAADFLIFTEKAPACAAHYEKHLKEAKLEHVLDGAKSIIEEFSTNGVVDNVEIHGNHVHCTFDHPLLEHRKWPTVPLPGETTAEQIKQAVAESVFIDFARYLTSDVITARRLGIPLGLGTVVHDQIISNRTTETNVALAIDLPILTGIPPKEALAIRNSEMGSFERFRSALSRAISESISSADPDANAFGVAADIINDVIAPSLNEIDDAMEKSKSLLNKKAALSIASGSILTVAGLIFSAPLLLPAGIALWGGGTLQSGQKHLEEKRDIQLKDMYFLWSREVQARRKNRGR